MRRVRLLARRYWQAARLLWWVIRLYRHLDPLRSAVLYRVSLALHDPAFWQARDAVKVTAVTLGMNKPHMWEQVMTKAQTKPLWAENQWRHIHAMTLLEKRVSHGNRTLDNPTLNLLTELGYVSFAIQPRDDAR